MACFGDSQENLAVLEQLLESQPSKFLELGTDQLLTGHFRGVLGVVEVVEVMEVMDVVDVVEVVEAPQALSWKFLTQNGSTGGLNPKEVPNTTGRSGERGMTWDDSLVMTASRRIRWCIRHPQPLIEQIFRHMSNKMDRRQMMQRYPDTCGASFLESFLQYFGLENGVEVVWRNGHPDVYQRHSWKRRNDLQKGFRLLVIPWLRRLILRTYVDWKGYRTTAHWYHISRVS